MAESELSDVEIVAEMFQLARSGLFRTQEALLEQTQKQFPNEANERLQDCSRQLAELLWKTNHGDYNAEYARQRRPSKSIRQTSEARSSKS